MATRELSGHDASTIPESKSLATTDAPTSTTEDFLRQVAQGGDPTTPNLDAGTVDLGEDAARFEIRRRLGAGGFGTVYEAFDRETHARVALKTMNRSDPRALYRFKQEFRALSELSHPNLVQLYELRGRGQAWFFTMELLHGQDALAYVRTKGEPAFDEAKLVSVFRQLAGALCFLHASGRLHRDIKPSNVMVTAEGRVVVLDFGLVVDLTAPGDQSVGAVTGTPRYMAPEQAGGDPIGPAADWYAVGVMLYQALTGRLPFEGSVVSVLGEKLTADPRPPAEWAPGLPEDLSRLCLDLLRREPSLRPSGDDVVERLARHVDRGSGAPARAPEDAAKKGAPFVGRAAQRAALREAFDAVCAGHTTATLVHGRSGMGKSALIARLLDELRAAAPDVVILEGRCFEQESVPYKALDGLVDALGRRLGGMAEAEVAALLPRDVATLSRLFPALGRVPQVASAPRRMEGADPITLRRRAFAALRELFARLGDRGPLVLVIDDLQWGDADSGALLAGLLEPPDAPVMLVILAYRTDEAERGECLRALLPALHEAGEALGVREVEVGALGEEEARALARAELAGSAPTQALEERVSAIARESSGWPFFIRELCHFSGDLGEAHPSLEAVLWARVSALPEGARRLLEVIAVAGQPIERGAAVRAAELGDDGPPLLALLRREHLVRMLGESGRDRIEAYHDRIRETLIGRLAAEVRRRHHLGLATALLDAGQGDEETLAIHLEGAGEPAKAAEHALRAADQAMEALGADRAARLYRQAIASMTPGDPRWRELHEKLGAALGNGGRGPEAAAAYLAAAAGAAPAEALELQRRAAEHYLNSGHIEKGLEVLRTVLPATGLSMPRTRIGVLIQLLLLVVLLWLRGLRFRERPEHEIPAEVLLRIDVCATVSFGLMSVDMLRSMCFHKRLLWLALRAGDPYRVLRALLVETGLAAARGASDLPTRSAERIERLMVPLLERFRDGSARSRMIQSVAAGVRGYGLLFRGRFRESREQLERALSEAERSGVRLASEVAMSRLLLVQVLFSLGAWKEAFGRQAAFLEEARARGDLFLEINLSSFSFMPALIKDRPDVACEVIAHAETLWSRADSSRRRGREDHLWNHVTTALYRDAGVGRGALSLVTEAWPALARSGLITFSGTARAAFVSLRGRAHLAAAASEAPSRRPGLLRAAERDARALERIRLKFAAASGASLRAGVAAGRGDRDRACELLAEAEEGFLALDMALDAAASRRRRGEILGGEEGRALVASADAVMSGQGILNPARMAAMFLPGAW